MFYHTLVPSGNTPISKFESAPMDNSSYQLVISISAFDLIDLVGRFPIHQEGRI
jgi:hypothetical protein